MVLVPAFIEVGGVEFPLMAYVHGVRLAEDQPRGGDPLGYLVEHLVVKRQGSARVTELERREDFSARELYAVVVTTSDTVRDQGDSVINWIRIAGVWPDLTDAYRVGTTFLKERLAIPRAVLIKLIEEVGRLNDEVLAGTREPRIEAAPPARIARLPEVVEYDRLAEISTKFADEYFEKLLTWRARGGLAETMPMELEEASDEMTSEDLLADLDDRAAALDELDRAARRGPTPYTDEMLAAQIAATRRTLLFELDVAGVLSEGIREQLVDLGLSELIAYHDAAMAMHRYFASPVRARIVGSPPPESVVEGHVSLDWFRTPSGYVPALDSPADWLAVCERNFANNAPPGAVGMRFTKLEGRMHQLHYRMEAATTPQLWRATLEGADLPDRPPVQEVRALRSEPAPEFPLERELDVGSYQITEHLWGTPDRGCYRGTRLLDGESVLITLGRPSQLSRGELVRALAISARSVAPLRGIVELVEPNQPALTALVEDAPAGVPLASLGFPIAVADAVALGIAIARVLAEAHAAGQIVYGIRPELIYVDRSRVLTGLAPRAERMWSLATRPDYGVPLAFDELYFAPELAAGRDAVPASDVFSLSAVLFHMIAGDHPFAASSPMMQIAAIAAGRHAPCPAPVADVLDRGLAVNPADRPSAAQLVEMLARVATI